MRMTAFLLLVACMHIAAKGVSQVVSVKATRQPLQTVFLEMSRQTGISFLYNEKEIAQLAPVTLDVKNTAVTQVLEQVLAERHMQFHQENNIIYIEKTAAANMPVAADSNLVTVSGIVLDAETNNGLMAATVIIKGTQRGLVTLSGGAFELKNVPRLATITVSIMGYEPQEFLVTPGKNEHVFTHIVTMKVAVSNLDETIIQAYGTTTKRKTTGDIVTVKGEDIARQPVANPILALQGRVPGLEIKQINGSPSAPVKVEIRGRKSINNALTSEPLYVVDGVPFGVSDVTSGQTLDDGTSVSRGLDQTGLVRNGGISPLFMINPRDIESITVLKDADATAIYGSRGANGVIIITTKKGQPGKDRFEVTVQEGISYIYKRLPVLNTATYLQMRREAFANDGKTPSTDPLASNVNANAIYAPDVLIWDTTRYTDWQKYFYGRTGKNTTAQVGLSGGTEQVTYRVSGGYNRVADITTLSGASTQASVTLSLNTVSRNKRFTSGVNAIYGFAKNNSLTAAGSTMVAPNAPSLFDSIGKLNWGPYRAAQLQVPYSGFSNTSINNTGTLNASIQLGYAILDNLHLLVAVGYNKSDGHTTNLTTIESQDPLRSPKPTASASFGGSYNQNFSVEPQLSYNKAVGKKGQLTFLLGATYINQTTSFDRQDGSNYANDALLGSIINAPTISASDGYAAYKYNGGFSRISMSWAEKYFLNLDGRRDGSSRFGPKYRFGNFGSFGAGWIATDEPWIRKAIPTAINYFKLRGSYGVVGSDAVGNYQYLTQWGANSPGALDVKQTPYDGVTPLIPQLLANDQFHWQTTTKLEVALDMGFLDNRFGFSIAYYRDRCDNQLVSYPTPYLTGFSYVTANSPAGVQNSGIESHVNGTLINNKDFNWTVYANISRNRNILRKFDNIEQTPYFTTSKVGDAIGTKYGLHFIEVDPTTGNPIFEDANHDGQISSAPKGAPGSGTSDYVTKLPSAPKYFGGFGQSFRWKNWSLQMDFSYSNAHAITNAVEIAAGRYGNISQWQFDHAWHHPGQQGALAPAFRTTSAPASLNYYSSDAIYFNVSSIRLRTVSLSYNASPKLAHLLHTSDISLFANAQNLWVWSPYLLGDPEVTTIGSSRTIVGGLRASF